MAKTQLLVIETGQIPEELTQDFGDYYDQFRELLADDDVEMSVCRIVSGETLPAPDAYDAYLITGSKHGVYEDIPWIPALESFIREGIALNKKFVGICFGHQILAQAMGGKVIKSPKGWGLGPHRYEILDNTLLDGENASFSINAVHQDQVVEQPANTKVLARSEFCEYAALAYGDGTAPTALSFQAHPEFAKDYTSALLKARRGSAMPEDVVDDALSSMEAAALDRARAANWILKFIKSA